MSKATKRFIDTLLEIRGGDLNADLTAELRALVAQVKERGGIGQLTLTLRVKRASKGIGTTLLITDEVKVKGPKQDERETILFANEDGDLQRNDPRQPKLPDAGPENVTGFPRPASAQA